MTKAKMEQGTVERCRKECLRNWRSNKGKGGVISTRDAAVASLPPLPKISCWNRKKAKSQGCHCSLLMENYEHQQQLRRHYCAWVKKSKFTNSGNLLLASFITPSKKADRPECDKLLRKGKASEVIHHGYRLPGFREKEKTEGVEIRICSTVFGKLFNLGKARLKKVQGLSTRTWKLRGMHQGKEKNVTLNPRAEQGSDEGVGMVENVGDELQDIKKDNTPNTIVIEDEMPHAATMARFGTLVDVPADGNCGFAAFLWGLCHDLQLQNTRDWGMDKLRRVLREHAVERRREFLACLSIAVDGGPKETKKSKMRLRAGCGMKPWRHCTQKAGLTNVGLLFMNG